MEYQQQWLQTGNRHKNFRGQQMEQPKEKKNVYICSTVGFQCQPNKNKIRFDAAPYNLHNRMNKSYLFKPDVRNFTNLL